MTITIKDPAIERDLLALAASKGGDIEEALGELLGNDEPPASALQEQSLTEGQKRIRQALQELKKIVPPVNVVLDDSRESYYVDDHGRLPGMDGYGQSE